MTFTEENYLKAIYKLSRNNTEDVTTNAIAEEVSTRSATVTDMLKKLSEKKLIHYQKYQGVSLTEEGKTIAIMVIRKQRLWEVFLVNKLGFGWDKVHEIAEQLEHIISDELIDRLDTFLGYPRFDPHGDPIPDKDGVMHSTNAQKLSDAASVSEFVVVGVGDYSPTFLQYLDKIGIGIHSKFKVLEINDFDKSLLIQLNGKNVFVSNELAKGILVSKRV